MRPTNKAVMIKIFTILIFIFSIFSIATAQSWTTNGPTFKNIKVVSQSPSNPNIVYAGAFGWGVFKSIDGGVSWTNYKTGMINTHVRSVLALNDTIVFAGTNDGVFKTTNGGLTWASSLATLHSIRSIAYDAKTGSIYTASFGLGLYKTTNLGTTWTNITVNDPTTGETLLHLWSCAVFGRDSLYVGGSILDITAGGSLFVSINGGTSWTQVQYPTGIRSSVHTIAISPNKPDSSLIIGTAVKGVYKSTNAGTNWSDINAATSLNPILDKKINTVAFNTSFRYAGTDSLGKFYYRALGDTTIGWLSGTGLPGSQAIINDIDINVPRRNILFVGTDGKAVYKSIDSGFTWQSSNSGMLGTAGRCIKLNSNGNLILGTDFGDGIWLSTDQATTWLRADTLTTSNSITGLVTTNVATTLYAADYGTGVYKSLDGGHVWHITDSTVINHFIRSLAAHPTNANIVYAGTGNGVYKTINGGVNWIASSTGIPTNTSVRSIEIDTTNPNVLYIGTDSTYMFKTIDAGATWTQISNANGFLVQDKFIRSITIDGTIPNILYAGADSGRIYKSMNNGSSWNLLVKLPATHSVRSILIDPHDRKTLFAGTFGDGIFMSVDSGANWSTFNTGLSDLEIYSLVSDNASPLNIYAGSGGHGVFHTTYSFINHPPVLATIGNKSISPGQQLTFTVSATDPDGTIPSLSVSGLPLGAVFHDSLNGHGSFKWTPTSGQTGVYSLTFKASDGILIDSAIVLITVVNHPPVIAFIGNKSVLVGHNLSIIISATDPDGTIPSLSTIGLPLGASFTDSLNGHGLFKWVPSNLQMGSTNVSFIASDGSLADTQKVVISVLDSAISIIIHSPMLAGWNLLAVPLLVNDFKATTIFPTATTPAYSYSGSYVPRDTLQAGYGYWEKFTADQIIDFGGTKLTLDTINVNANWNIIGSLSYTIPISGITPILPVTIISSFFGYSSSIGYTPADSIYPGRGYWVKVDQSGKLIMAKTGPLKVGTANNILSYSNISQLLADNRLNSITFINEQGEKRSLYFTSSDKLTSTSQYELPPMSPENNFDVRFASQGMLMVLNNQKLKEIINITGSNSPLTLQWNITENNVLYSFDVIDGDSRSYHYQLSGKGSSVISHRSIATAQLSLDSNLLTEIPHEFKLEQNYPNPFNPSTTFSYALPTSARVKLTIFNILGQEVSVIKNDVEDAGFHSTVWDAKNVGSGIYFYMLQIFDPGNAKLLFRETKKLSLVK